MVLQLKRSVKVTIVRRVIPYSIITKSLLISLLVDNQVYWNRVNTVSTKKLLRNFKKTLKRVQYITKQLNFVGVWLREFRKDSFQLTKYLKRPMNFKNMNTSTMIFKILPAPVIDINRVMCSLDHSKSADIKQQIIVA